MDSIKLIVSEIDGIVTEGLTPIDELGNIPYKIFNEGDFEAINELKKHCTFVFMSSDQRINYHLCRRRNIPFFWAKKDKLKTLTEIMMRYNVSADQTLYIGSKISDMRCIQMVPTSFVSNNSPLAGLYGTKLHVKCGEGVITSIYLKYFK